MTMTEREATTIVDTLHRAYPTYPVDGRTLYIQALMRCAYDVSIAAAAVHGYIVNEPWMPKVSELLDVIEIEAASRNLVRTRALPPGAERPASREQRTVIVDVLRTVLAEMPPPGFGRGDPGYSERFDARCRELTEAQGVTIVDDPPDRQYICARCQDTGFEVETAANGTAVCIPCPCNPARYDRWRGGHFEPGHSCKECEAIAKGKR